LFSLFACCISVLAAVSTGAPSGVHAQGAASSPTAPPTNTRRPTSTPTLTPAPTVTPYLRPTFIATNNPGFGTIDATYTPEPDTMTFYTETFLLGRPIPPDYVNYLSRNYAYGSRDGGGRPTHYGDDFQNPTGTPVIAAADGIIEYAGDDIHVLFGPQPNFYGNVIVIRHNFADVDGRAVFTLYGHLSRIEVATGQPVTQGQIIGLVGSAGVAVGAHLHFEVRIGNPNDYGSTRNPELWMKPFTASGVIAARVMDTTGNLIHGIVVSVKGGANRDGETYWDDGVKGDTRLQENLVIGDLPGGYYQVIIRTLEGALKYRNTVFIRPSRVTFLTIYITP
jgi:murein DD-endopeptidase MepM/ murein hydrolase activator NlpD